MKESIKKMFGFFRHGVWTVDESKLKRRQRYFVKLVRIIIIAFEDFMEKNLILQASALTFYTLLSIVPVAAMVFGIAQGFGLEERLREELFRAFNEQPELLEQLLGFSERLLDNTEGGIMAVFGFIVLLWSVLQVISSIEESFNSIWQVTVPRTWIRKFTDYFSILLLAPVLVIAMGSITIFISTIITGFAEEWINLGFLKQIIVFSIKLIPFVLSSLLFMFIYTVIPNTKVKAKPALIAGIVAGFFFQFFQWGYVEFQVGVSRYNAIYGSFAFFPLFIIFLQLSWVIVLIGAEVSYSLQNIELHMDERLHFVPSKKEKLILAISTLGLVGQRFETGEKPYTAEELCQRLNLPYKVVKEYCFELHLAGLLNEIVDEKEEGSLGYQPALGVDKLTLAYVMDRLDNVRMKDYYLQLPAEFQPAVDLVEKLYQDTHDLQTNVLVTSLFEGKEGE